VTSPRGFTAAAAHAGLKTDGAPDVALLVSAASCATAGVFTQNALRAAPVVYDADLLAERPGRMRAVAMNARVANACTGAPGLAAARAMAQAAEQAAGLPPRTALVLSTGVIGVPLPLEQVADGLRAAAGRLTPEGGPDPPGHGDAARRAHDRCRRRAGRAAATVASRGRPQLQRHLGGRGHEHERHRPAARRGRVRRRPVARRRAVEDVRGRRAAGG